MTVELDAADLWNIADSDHLYVKHSSDAHSLTHELRVIDTDRHEANDGSATVTITGEILQDDRSHVAELETTRDSHTSDWSGITCETSFTDKPGIVETILRFPNPETDRSWDEHATDLYNSTVLSEREAAVQALKHRELNHRQTGLVLGIDKSSVDEYSSRIGTKRELAANTVTELQ